MRLRFSRKQLCIPYAVFLICFVIAPLLVVLYYAFTNGLIQALDCMKMMGRVALLGCTRNSHFEIDYYGKVHAKGISLIGAHTMARPKVESSAGLFTDDDDLKSIFNLTLGKRLNFADMICEIHSPAEAGDVYERLINEKNFPIGVLFDWSRV